MGFTLIAAGLVFFFNPNVNVVDIFPDFIGCLLIWFGLKRLSRLNEDLRCAAKSVVKLAVVDLIKPLITLMLISESLMDEVMYLLIAFSFGVIECILFVSAMSALIEGTDHLSIRYSGETTGKKSVTAGAVKSCAIIFYFAKTAIGFLPELTELQAYESSGYMGQLQYSGFKGIFYVVGIVVVLIWSVFFLRSVLGYFRTLKNDKELCQALYVLEADFLKKNQNYFTSSRMRTALAVFAAAVLFICVPDYSGLIGFPLAFCACILTLTSILISKYDRRAYAVSALSVACAVLSFIEQRLQSSYFEYYDSVEDAVRISEAGREYLNVSHLSCLQYVILTVAFVVIICIIFDILLKHSDTIAKASLGSNVIEADFTASLVNTLKKHRKAVKILAVIGGLFGAVRPYLCYGAAAFAAGYSGETDSLKIDMLPRLFTAFSICQFLICVAWFIITLISVSYARKTIYDSVYSWGPERDSRA